MSHARLQPPNLLADPLGSISGTISYSGAVTGTHLFWVGAFTTTQGGPPLYATTRSGPGPYTMTGVLAGQYQIMGGMDADDSGGPPDPAIDPLGVYADNPVTVQDGVVVTDVNIRLVDPAGAGTISGWIGYTGSITVAHNIVIYASRVGVAEPPVFSTVISGSGPYTLTNVAPYTYTVSAFMDLGDDMGPPNPDEPFGSYDPDVNGIPNPIVLNEDAVIPGIDIQLRDPTRYLYLPTILKSFGG